MAKAHKAPRALYQRHYYVSHHAIERLRQRIESNNTTHRPDGDLGNWLDRAVVNAVNKGRITELRNAADGKQGKLVELTSGEFGAKGKSQSLYAVIHDNHNSSPPEAIVTVLSQEMVTKLWAENVWQPPPLNTPFAKALKGVSAAKYKPKPKTKPDPARQCARVYFSARVYFTRPEWDAIVARAGGEDCVSEWLHARAVEALRADA